MPTLYIPGFEGQAFDLFDALGIVPKSSYTVHDIQLAWRAAFKVLHADRKHINGIYVPKFPTVDHITRAKDWLSEDPENVETAHESLARSYQSTWNPHAKAGTPAVLQPIPGAVADPVPPHAIGNHAGQFQSRKKVHWESRAETTAEYYADRTAQRADRPARPSPGERDDPRPWRERRKDPGARAHRESNRPDVSASNIIDDMFDQNPDLESLLNAANVKLR